LVAAAGWGIRCNIYQVFLSISVSLDNSLKGGVEV